MERFTEYENASLRCDSCREFFHQSEINIIFQDGVDATANLCTTCKRDHEELLAAMDQEPECTCHQTDVDLFDARGCDAHDSNSPWNVKQRALCASERGLSFRLWPMEVFEITGKSQAEISNWARGAR